MMDIGNTWAIVLAAGEGSRLRSLTTISSGTSVPKQFCSLRGGPSLLQETLLRARAVTTPQRTCVIVAKQHRRWWEEPLRSLPRQNVIVQPENRGTANGILLSLLHVLERDPRARIVFLPSDHHVTEERILRRSLREAMQQLQSHRREILLLGLEPDEIDPELGYIVPGSADGMLHRVERFIEKPSLELARTLISSGALWNAFIVAVDGQALLDVFMRLFPDIVADMRAAVAHDAGDPMNPEAAERVYAHLPVVDFSRDILQITPAQLRIVPVPSCGWSDLGTPGRVAKALSRIPNVDVGMELLPLCHPLVLAEQQCVAAHS
jgi:mannose-1-phosphate guanylyltransferase